MSDDWTWPIESCSAGWVMEGITDPVAEAQRFLAEYKVGDYHPYTQPEDTMAEIHRAARIIHALLGAMNGRPATHELLLGDDRWSVKHPIRCNVHDCDMPGEDELDYLIRTHGTGCLLVEQIDGGWVRGEELHEVEP